MDTNEMISLIGHLYDGVDAAHGSYHLYWCIEADKKMAASNRTPDVPEDVRQLAVILHDIGLVPRWRHAVHCDDGDIRKDHHLVGMRVIDGFCDGIIEWPDDDDCLETLRAYRTAIKTAVSEHRYSVEQHTDLSRWVRSCDGYMPAEVILARTYYSLGDFERTKEHIGRKYDPTTYSLPVDSASVIMRLTCQRLQTLTLSDPGVVKELNLLHALDPAESGIVNKTIGRRTAQYIIDNYDILCLVFNVDIDIEPVEDGEENPSHWYLCCSKKMWDYVVSL